MQRVIRIICICLLSVVAESVSASVAETVDSVIARRVRERGVELGDGNSVSFFDNGHDKFEALFRDIRNAKSSVHLEYFNFRNDSIAGLLFRLLGEKVAQGVEVRAMYDDFGNRSNNSPISRKMHDSIAASGIRLKRFDPIRFPWVNHIIPRDHRKIVVIDGRIAYTGGMNVADYYINGIEGIGDWHDLHLRMEGPAVRYVQEVFCNTWESCVKEHLEGERYFPRISGTCGEKRLAVIDRAPGRSSDAIRDLYATMIEGARYSIKIINPYFMPTHRVRKALKDAIKRGVKVEILLSAKGDIPMTPQATHYVGNNLMKRGATVYLFEGGFHHTKMMIVDDVCCTVGSANLDSRSLRCDYEINTLILDKTSTAELSVLFENQKRSSILMYKGWFTSRCFGHRFYGWLGNLLTPVM